MKIKQRRERKLIRAQSVLTLFVCAVVFCCGCVEPVVPIANSGMTAGETSGGTTTPTNWMNSGFSFSGGEQTAGVRGAGEGMPSGMTEGGRDGGESGPDVDVMSGDDTPLSCTPGDSLGVCVECAPGNTRRVPTQDDQCEPIDCSLEVSHRLVSSEGRVECRVRRSQPGPSICQGEGACYTSAADYCSYDEAVEEVVMTSDEIEECREISACDDSSGPEAILAPGALCRNGAGTCDESGTCILMSCEALFDWRYNNNNELCDDQIDQGYCEFLVNSGNNPWNVGGETNCNEFCSAMGGTCLQAWGEDDDSCRKTDTKECSERFNDSICRCAPAAP